MWGKSEGGGEDDKAGRVRGTEGDREERMMVGGRGEGKEGGKNDGGRRRETEGGREE